MMRTRTHNPSPLELTLSQALPAPRLPLEKANSRQKTVGGGKKGKRKSGEGEGSQRTKREAVMEKRQDKVCKGVMQGEVVGVEGVEVVDVDELTTLTVRQEPKQPYELNDIKQIISWRVQRDEWRLTNPSLNPHANTKHPAELSTTNSKLIPNPTLITWLLTPPAPSKQTRGSPRRATRSNPNATLDSSSELNEGDVLSADARLQMLKLPDCLKILDGLKNCRVPNNNLAKVLCLPEYRRYSVQHVFFVHRLRKQLSQREIVAIL